MEYLWTLLTLLNIKQDLLKHLKFFDLFLIKWDLQAGFISNWFYTETKIFLLKKGVDCENFGSFIGINIAI